METSGNPSACPPNHDAKKCPGEVCNNSAHKSIISLVIVSNSNGDCILAYPTCRHQGTQKVITSASCIPCDPRRNARNKVSNLVAFIVIWTEMSLASSRYCWSSNSPEQVKAMPLGSVENSTDIQSLHTHLHNSAGVD